MQFQPSKCCWHQSEDFTTSRINIFCLFVQLPTELITLLIFSLTLMHNLLVNELTGSESMLGGRQAVYLFDHSQLVLSGNFNFI